MVDEVAKLGVGIVGDDRTASAFSSVEKRAEKSRKRVSEINRKADNDNQRRVSNSTRTVLGSIAKVEKATSRVLGGRSLLSGLAGRMTGLSEASSALGEGFAGASLAGEGLAATALGVAGAVGGTIAILGAATYAAFKFGDGWAKSTAQLSRTAEVVGVSTKAMTEFDAAAQRAGAQKGAGVAGMSSLNQTLNDARYGRNSQALAVLRRVGVGMKLNKDGTVDTAAMLPVIANAMRRQNSSGRRTLARYLGISDDLIPAFSQGGKQLAADMKDADKNAVVVEDSVGKKARAADRKRVLSDQSIDAAKYEAGRRVSDMTSGNLGDVRDKTMQAFNDAVHGEFKSASKRLGEASDSLDKASETLGEKIWKHTDPILGHVTAMADRARIWGSGSSPSFGSAPAKRLSEAMQAYMSMGWSKEAGAGIAASEWAESSSNAHPRHNAGHAGAYQWDATRQANFRRVIGKSVDDPTVTLKENREFANWELHHTHKKAGDALRKAKTASEAAEIVSRMYEMTDDGDYQAARRADIAESIVQTPTDPQKVQVHVTVENGKATKVKTTTGSGSKAAVSHAMVN
ncbi:phage tail tip lysozyme [Novosphingobium sp. 9]|uniref:phage tail tip lysozyme n=1 Tax=Novosphingobium sp. 9 TaxID=2025349 RepID=UPI0021B6462A|nr:phage tail tip lysozyme [Novosphingobium sp. 9]